MNNFNLNGNTYEGLAENLWMNHLSLSQKLNDENLTSLLNKGSRLLFPTGKYAEAQNIFKQVLENASTESAEYAIAKLGVADTTYLDRSQAKIGEKALLALVPLYEELVALFEKHNDQNAVAFCLKRIAWAHASNDDVNKAEQVINKAYSIAESNNNKYVLGYCYYCKALISTMKCNFDLALEELEKCENYRESVGDYHGVGAARIGKSKVYAGLGEYSSAIQAIESSNDIFKALNNDYVVGAIASHSSALYASMTRDLCLEVDQHTTTNYYSQTVGKIASNVLEYSKPMVSKMPQTGGPGVSVWPG